MIEALDTPSCTGHEEIVDNRPSAVKVENVTMMFNIASEQLNNLKEYAIAVARRELMFKEFLALQDVSFEVKKGDVFGILGTNGSGKSTMMKIIAGVLEPTKGTCTVNGNIAPLIELGAGFDMDLTARENIYLNGALLGYNKKFIDQHFDQIVEFAEVEEFLDMPLKNYSSGMVARIAFAIATVIIPEILLVDEVLSVGDFMFQKKCENRIKELIDQHGVTVIIVSHTNDQIARLCNKAIWIEKGHTRFLGNAQEVCAIYGTLGGRKGSKESEKQVFDTLELSMKEESLPVRSIFGSDPCSTAAQLYDERLNCVKDGHASNTVIVTSVATHINSVFASSFTGALDAPILQTQATFIPNQTERCLMTAHPSKVLFLDCGQDSQGALAQLSSLSWQPELVDLSFESGYFPGYSLKLFEYGLEQGIWGKKIIAIDFDNQAEALAMTSYAAREHCPFMVVRGETGWNEFTTMAKKAHDKGFTEIIAVGRIHEEMLKEAGTFLPIRQIATEDSSNARCLAIAKWVADQTEGPIEICVTPADSTQWPYVFSAASYTHPKNGVILFEDPTNLDNIAACMQFVKEQASRTELLTFIGSTGSFTPGDYTLLNFVHHAARKEQA